MAHRRDPWHSGCPARAFTLIELMVVVVIIGILVALALPLAQSTVAVARSFKCQASQRNVAFDFQVFADETLHGQRGTDDDLPGERFRLETFQESQYSIDEFWAWPGEEVHRLPDAAGADPMRCAALRGDLVLERDSPCSRGGVGPNESISFGFNIRLHERELIRDGRIRRAPVLLNSLILSASTNVPLLMDVDGVVASAHEVSAVFIGPSLESRIFAEDRYWFPGVRHRGAANAAFIDGHVESSPTPARQAGWDWAFTPDE